MVKSQALKIPHFSSSRSVCLIFSLILWCPFLWAAQDAMVVTEKAVIYSDKEMTSPIGYITRGKKIVVGNVARNKAQVYPIIVSGKIAYIRVLDITTEKESMDSTRLTAERFQKSTTDVPKSKFVLGYYSFLSQVTQSKKNGELKDNEALLWHGISLKGEVLLKNRFDVQVITNYMGTSYKDEEYRVLEFGVGAAFRVFDHRKFLVRLEGQALAIPFSSYELGNEFRVKSYGYTTGGGLNLTYFLDEHWAMEATGGAYYTKLLAFDAPEPFADFSSTFIGGRFGFGINYTY